MRMVLLLGVLLAASSGRATEKTGLNGPLGVMGVYQENLEAIERVDVQVADVPPEFAKAGLTADVLATDFRARLEDLSTSRPAATQTGKFAETPVLRINIGLARDETKGTWFFLATVDVRLFQRAVLAGRTQDTAVVTWQISSPIFGVGGEKEAVRKTHAAAVQSVALLRAAVALAHVEAARKRADAAETEALLAEELACAQSPDDEPTQELKRIEYVQKANEGNEGNPDFQMQSAGEHHTTIVRVVRLDAVNEAGRRKELSDDVQLFDGAWAEFYTLGFTHVASRDIVTGLEVVKEIADPSPRMAEERRKRYAREALFYRSPPDSKVVTEGKDHTTLAVVFPVTNASTTAERRRQVELGLRAFGRDLRRLAAFGFTRLVARDKNTGLEASTVLKCGTSPSVTRTVP